MPAQRPTARSTAQAAGSPGVRRRRALGPLGRPATGVVVTGGASGIGRATCLALAEVGRSVAVLDVDAAGARRTAHQCTERHQVPAVGYGVDVTDSEAVAVAVKKATAKLGVIGGLVHAAGIGGPMPVTMIDDDTWDAVLDVNLRAAAILTMVLAPALRQAGPGSAIVHISSIEGYFGNHWLPAYASSKAGLLGLTRSSAHTLGIDGIRVNAVCPGAVDTPLLAPLLAIDGTRASLEARTPLGRLADPDDVARVVRFLLSEEAAFITGTALVVDGGLTAINGV